MIHISMIFTSDSSILENVKKIVKIIRIVILCYGELHCLLRRIIMIYVLWRMASCLEDNYIGCYGFLF